MQVANKRARLARKILVFIVLAFGCCASSLHARTAEAEAPLRAEWRPEHARFVRGWSFWAPGAQTQAGASEGALAPGNGGDWSTVWSWGDVVDVAGSLGRASYRGAAAAPEYAFAYARVVRDADGPAQVSIASDGPVRVWVNGVAVLQTDGAGPFVFDAHRAPIQLRRGDNAILVKTEHRSGPWRFALRIIPAGAIPSRVAEITPVVVPSPDGALAVQTDAGASTGAPVTATVIAAGGRAMAHGQAERGAVLRFAASDWPDGAYEVRLETRDATGRAAAVHLPWYKGDARVEINRLIETARNAPDDVAGDHLRMLSDMALDRAGGAADALPDDGWPLAHSALMEFEELQSGGSSAIRPWGFVRLAYRDGVDASTQYCRVYLPPGYSSDQRWPLVLYLHGYNPPNPPYVRWWGVDQRHNDSADRFGVIWIEVHGRGNSQYTAGLGEQDVLTCLNEAKRRFSVDEDRVYLTGESMGGSGTWLVGSRHADLFAAIAPVFGGWDYRVAPLFGVTFTNPQADTLPERYLQEAQSSFVSAEGLLHTPVLVLHGDVDQSVNVENSRHVVRMLQRWGYDVRYHEFPGFGHEDLNARDEIVSWLLSHRRVAAPARVRIRSMDLDGASAYWARVLAQEAPLTPLQVDAEFLAPGRLRLDTRNVAAIALTPPAQFISGDRRMRVLWNGREQTLTIPASGEATLTAGFRPGETDKRPGLEGGLSAFIATPFAIVYGGASEDPEMRRLCREKAEMFAALWARWQHVQPRLVADRDLTDADARRYSLLLIGGADANLVSRRLGARLPLNVSRDSVTIDRHRFAASDAVVQMIYPSPLAPQRYVVVVAATSAAGMYFWNPAGFWNQTFGFPTLAFDWTIEDGRRVSLAPGLSPHRGWIASGVFDSRWRVDDRWIFAGDAGLRASSPLRHAPTPDVTAGAPLADYAGRYQLAPGLVASVVQEQDGLSLAVPGAPAERLVAEGGDAFGARSSSASIRFERADDGAIGAIVINTGGQETTAARLR